MPVTVVDFQENINHYLQLVSKQDVFIMQDGKIIAKLTQSNQSEMPRQASLPQRLTKRANSDEIMNAVNSLVGILPDNGMTLNEDHPLQGNAVRLSHRLHPEAPDPVADIF